MSEAVISTLNELIQTCRDGEQGLRLAAEHVKDSHLKETLEGLARERGELAAELQHEVERRGSPRTSGSVAGAAHRGWLDVRSALTRGDEHIVAEAERGEDVPKRTFEEALSGTRGALDPETRQVVERVARRVIAAHDAVRRLEKTTARH